MDWISGSRSFWASSWRRRAAGSMPAEPDREGPDRVGQPVPDGDVRRGRASLRAVRLDRQDRKFWARHDGVACRLLSLHLRRGTPIDEIIEQCRGIKDMAPTPNVQDDGTVVWNTGVGDAIAQVLRKYSDELERL